MLFQPQDNLPHGIHGCHKRRHALRCHSQATIATKAKHALSRMSQLFQTRQAKKAASPLDVMHLPENLSARWRIIRRVLQSRQRLFNKAQAFMGFQQKIRQQIVHHHPRAWPQERFMGQRLRIKRKTRAFRTGES